MSADAVTTETELDAIERALRGPMSIPYRLQVETTVTRANAEGLKTSGGKLVALIQNAGLGLRLSAWDYHDQRQPNDEVHLFHYWDMTSDANQLLRAELLLPDEPEYAKFADLIISEQKDIVLPITPIALKPSVSSRDPQSDQYRYFRVRYDVKTQGLAEFAAKLEAGLVPFAMDQWTLGDAYIGLTGRSGDVIQIWRTPEGVSQEQAKRKIGESPWTANALVEEIQPLWPTPFDPGT